MFTWGVQIFCRQHLNPVASPLFNLFLICGSPLMSQLLQLGTVVLMQETVPISQTSIDHLMVHPVEVGVDQPPAKMRKDVDQLVLGRMNLIPVAHRCSVVMVR
jgi:hypothetical protein